MASKKKALISGVTGQDGSYLAELLLAKGYEVHGIIRRASTFNTARIDHIFQDLHTRAKSFFLHYGDLADANTIRKLIQKIEPDEIYNLGAQSHVRVSFDIPEYTVNITGLGTLRILEAIKDYGESGGKKKIRFYQASSSELFGSTPPPQNELTLFHPRSPYACAKAFAYYTTINYREAYGLFAVNGIMFNHESERRGETFVTRKITRGIARIIAGLDKKLYLGNLDAKRDWGYCYDEDTEVLTKDGWKLFKNLNKKDTVATLNKDQYIEYHKPSKIIRKKYKGKMLLLQNRHLDLLVTPNHNLYVKHNNKDAYELLPAATVFNSINEWKFKKDALWKGKKTNFFILPSIIKYKSKRREPIKKLNISDWLEFLGWYISEGSFGSGKKGDYRIGVSQSIKKESYRLEIKRCFEKLGFDYHENKAEFRINDKQLWDYLKQFGKARNKHAPLFIKELMPSLIMSFLNSLFKGDGNGVIDADKNCNFYTSSKKLVDDVQELLLKCGFSGNIKIHKNRESSYRINIISKYNTPSFKGNDNPIIKYVDYSNRIYCCTVKNHVLYVRRNGKGYWCGNSPEYMEAAWLMLQQPKAGDFVIGTGESHSVREFVTEAFKVAGIADWKKFVEFDKRYLRPTEVNDLYADTKKATRVLKWKPKTNFKQLVKIMVEHDLKKHGVELAIVAKKNKKI